MEKDALCHCTLPEAVGWFRNVHLQKIPVERPADVIPTVRKICNRGEGRNDATFPLLATFIIARLPDMC